MQKEEWRDIAGYKGLYQVSNFGNVRGIKRGGVLSPHTLQDGYCQVMLCKDGKVRGKLNHRLVAEAFIPNSDNKPQVNHIDGDKTNNKVDNLEWVTQSENQLHAIKTGLQTIKRGSECYNSVKVEMLDIETDEVVNVFDSMAEASAFIHKPHGNIWRCCNGLSKSAYGYKWRYYG